MVNKIPPFSFITLPAPIHHGMTINVTHGTFRIAIKLHTLVNSPVCVVTISLLSAALVALVSSVTRWVVVLNKHTFRAC